MTRPGRFALARPRPTAGGVEYDNSGTGMDADTLQEAIDELFDLIEAVTGATGFPRPTMVLDVDSDIWQVLVDGDGNAVMITG